MPAWVTPRTFVTSEIVTASHLNVNIRDNTGFLHDPPCCRVYNSANQTVGSATTSTITFNSERFDTDTMHSTSSNTSRITFTTAGKYRVTGQVRWAANATGRRLLSVVLNNTTTIIEGQGPVPATGECSHSVDTLYQFAAGDYVELRVYQDSGGNLDVLSSAASSPEFMAMWESG